MNQFKNTKKTLIFITILVVITTATYIVFFIGIKNKNESISLVANEIDIALEKEVKLKSIKNLIKDTENDRAKLNAYFVVDDKVIDFIEDIENLAKDTNVDLKVMSIDINDDGNNTPQQNNISELLQLNLKVAGLWDNLFHFISLVDELPFRVDISKVNLQVVYDSNNKDKNPTDWEGMFVVSVLKLKENVNGF